MALEKNEILGNYLFKELEPHIVRKFVRFHLANPLVYEAVKRFANEAKHSARKKFGIRMIWERMRWYSNIETLGSEYKLCDSYHSCYARLLMIEDPFFLTMFRRKQNKPGSVKPSKKIMANMKKDVRKIYENMGKV